MIAAVLTYASARMKALGYTEHKSTFNLDNIPRTKRDTVFHVEQNTVTPKTVSGSGCYDVNVPFTVRVFSGQSCESLADRDKLLEAGDTIIDDMVLATNAQTQTTGLKNVLFGSLTLEPLSGSNENSLILKIEFTGLVIKST